MIHDLLRATIAALVLLPVCAQAGPIIVYESVEARSGLSALVVNRDTGEPDSDDFGSAATPSPQDASVSAALASTSSTLGLDYDLNQANNSFSVNGSIEATGNDLNNSFARAFFSVGLFVDFTIESDTDDMVELVFSADGSIRGEGLEGLVTDGRLFGVTALQGPVGASFGFRDRDNDLSLVNVISGTESFLVAPGESFRILTLIDIDNRAISSGGDGHQDVIANFQLTSSLAVRSVPEPWSLMMLAFGLLTIGWSRSNLSAAFGASVSSGT